MRWPLGHVPKRSEIIQRIRDCQGLCRELMDAWTLLPLPSVVSWLWHTEMVSYPRLQTSTGAFPCRIPKASNRVAPNEPANTRQDRMRVRPGT